MSVSRFLAESIRSKEELKPLVDVRDAHKDAEDEILDSLISSGAVLKGHFRLEGGQHSSLFFRFTNVAGNRESVQLFANRLITELKNDRVSFDAVLMQEASGRTLGEMIANNLNKRKIVVETDDHNRPTMNLINDSSLYRGDRVLVVSDLSTTGAGLHTMTSLVRRKKGIPVAVALFATRNKEEMSKFEDEEHLKVYALADLAFERTTYGERGAEVDEKDCVECRAGKPAILSWET